MVTKDYGAGASTYLDPEGRNWETIVYQQSKPVLDSELNFIQDLNQQENGRRRRITMPSGWLSSDITDTSSAVSAIFTASTTANELEIPQDLRAHINGWVIRVGNTNANGTNTLDLGAAPSGAGAVRTDLVILEVWRRQLDSSTGAGKSTGGRIWWYGNVKIASADDATFNFVADIEDANVGAETTQRVQIQYRLRVINDVDTQTYPDGISDPAVFAHSVPTAPGTPDGTVTVFNYSNQSANGDPGLWRAGDGSPANTLSTVDGYMYAVPLCAVFRRNTTAFARNTNHNGGVADPGPSDRPDGLFHDIFVARDVMDLRRNVNPNGWDLQELLDKNMNYLLDNSLQTEVGATLVGGGTVGHTVLTADEIGVSNANGGDGTTTGDTPGATFVGEFDALRRRFSDRATLETVRLAYTPADGSGGGPNWGAGDTVTLDPTSLQVYGYSAFNWAAYAPAGVTFVAVKAISFLPTSGGSGGANDAFGQIGDGTPVDLSDVEITGLGAVPVSSVTVTLRSGILTNITDETMVVTLVVTYPKGVGLTKTPTADFGADSFSVNNPGQLPATTPVFFEAFEDQSIDAPHREVALTYRTVTQTLETQHTGSDTDTWYMPERVESVSEIRVDSIAFGGAITISDDGYVISLDSDGFTADPIEIDYKARRPLPQNDEQLTIYYESRVAQMTRSAIVGTSLQVIPKYLDSHMYVMTVGSGSQDEAYPFPSQYVQVPGVYPTSGGSFGGDHEFDATSNVNVTGFSSATGFLKLPTLLPLVPHPEDITLSRVGGDIDAEGRAFFKATSGYPLGAWAQPLSDSTNHRTVVPMIAEFASDVSAGPAGTLVLALVSNVHSTADNMVGFDSDLAQNRTTVSVYRLKGNPLSNRRS